jgi:hypothetical protein
MSSTNLDLVRPVYVTLERGDYLSSSDWAHPEIELVFADWARTRLLDGTDRHGRRSPQLDERVE